MLRSVNKVTKMLMIFKRDAMFLFGTRLAAPASRLGTALPLLRGEAHSKHQAKRPRTTECASPELGLLV